MAGSPDIDWVEWERWKERQGRGENARGDFWQKYLRDLVSIQDWFRLEEEHEAAMADERLQPVSEDGRTPTASSFRPAQGATFKGKFSLGREIASGGGGSVWEAFDTSVNLHLPVAIKFHPSGSGGPPVGSLRREAELMRELLDAGASVVPVFEFGDNPPHIVMQLCKGDVCGLLKAPGTKSEAVRRAVLIHKVARTLGIAHANGYTHRDVKPGNILLNEADDPLVSDWGLATASVEFALGNAPPGHSRPYASPEQIDSKLGSLGPHSDVYSLGVVLFEMLVGRRPPSAYDRVGNETTVTGPPPFFSNIDTSLLPEIRAVCDKALALKQNDRYRNGAELADAIQAVVDAVEHRSTPGAIDFTALINEKTDGFFGRDWLLDDVFAWASSTTMDRGCMLVGPPLIGKSAVAATIVKSPGAVPMIAHHFCDARRPETCDPVRFVHSVAAMLCDSLGGLKGFLGSPPSQGEPQTADELFTWLANGLAKVQPPVCGRGLLVIDALDEAPPAVNPQDPPGIARLLSQQLGSLPNWLLIIVTTRHDRTITALLSSFYRIDLSTDARSLNDVKAYIRSRLADPNVAETIQSSQACPENVVDELSRKARALFGYAKLVLDAISRGQMAPDKFGDLPPGLYPLYDWFMRRLFPAATPGSFDLAKRVFSIVLAKQEPLPQELFPSCLNVTHDAVDKVLRHLRCFLTITSHDVTFFHETLGEWLTGDEARGGAFSVPMHDAHRVMADWCLRAISCGSPAAHTKEYVYRYVVTHLFFAGDVMRSWIDKIVTSAYFLPRFHEAWRNSDSCLEYSRRFAVYALHRYRCDDPNLDPGFLDIERYALSRCAAGGVATSDGGPPQLVERLRIEQPEELDAAFLPQQQVIRLRGVSNITALAVSSQCGSLVVGTRRGGVIRYERTQQVWKEANRFTISSLGQGYQRITNPFLQLESMFYGTDTVRGFSKRADGSLIILTPTRLARYSPNSQQLILEQEWDCDPPRILALTQSVDLSVECRAILTDNLEIILECRAEGYDWERSIVGQIENPFTVRLAVDREDNTIYIAAAEKRGVYLWDVKCNRLVHQPFDLPALKSVAVSVCSDMMCVAESNYGVIAWSAKSGKEVLRKEVRTYSVLANLPCAITSDGIIVFGDSRGQLTYLCPSTGMVISRFQAHLGDVSALACCRVDRTTRVISSGGDGFVRLWDSL